MAPFDIQLVTSERLQPAQPSPAKSAPLSTLDATTTNFGSTEAFWLFEKPEQEHSTTQCWRESLRLTLSAYPHWSGRIVAIKSTDGSSDNETRNFPPHALRYGRLYARYGRNDDAGVDFSMANSTATLNDLHPVDRCASRPVWSRDEIKMSCFASPAVLGHPLKPDYQEDSGQWKPLLAVQITRLACGGLVLAVKSTHVLADITTLICFVQDWARVHKALLSSQLPPELHRPFEPLQVDSLAAGDIDANEADQDIAQLAHSLPMHRYDWWKSSSEVARPPVVPAEFENQDITPMGTAMPWSEWNAAKPVSHCTIHFNRLQVDELWNMAGPETHPRISRHDALLAHVWSCIARARQNDITDTLHCDLTYGLRPVLGLPKDFIGTPLLMMNIAQPAEKVMSASGSDRREALGQIAQAVRRIIATMSNIENVKAHLHALAFEKSPQRIWQGFLGEKHTMVTTWARAGLYNVNFGFGSHLRFADGHVPLLDGVVLIKEGPTSMEESMSASWTANGVDVSICIGAEAMERLTEDSFLFPRVDSYK